MVKVEMVRTGLDLLFEDRAKIIYLLIGIECKREKTPDRLQGFDLSNWQVMMIFTSCVLALL